MLPKVYGKAFGDFLKRQMALYLLRRTWHGCRIVYYLRTTPKEMIQDFSVEFDGELRKTFESIAGLVLDDHQWDQASLRVKQSGLGLSRASDLADIAYLASRDGSFDDCVALDGNHVWDDGAPRQSGVVEVIGEWLGGAFAFGARPNTTIKQGLLNELVHKRRREEMVEAAGIWDKARLQAMSAPRAGSWLEAAPNQVLNTYQCRSSIWRWAAIGL